MEHRGDERLEKRLRYQRPRLLFQYECSHRELLCYVTIRKESLAMLRFAIAFFCGAATMTSVVVAAGVRTSGLVMLGFVGTNILYGLVICAVRPRRLGRLLLRLSGEPQQLKPGGVSPQTSGSSSIRSRAASYFSFGLSGREAQRGPKSDYPCSTEYSPGIRATIQSSHSVAHIEYCGLGS